jgi:hypothetical protein
MKKISHPIENDKCYVVHQGFGDLYAMFGYKRHDLITFPENGLTSIQRRIGIKYTRSIVTESAQMISCYDRNDVYIWRDGKWENPDIQTYGASYELLESDLLFFDHSIPMNICDSKLGPKLNEKLKLLYTIL